MDIDMDHRLESIRHNLATAGAGDPTGIVSVKLRPTAEREGYCDRYVYPPEYDELGIAFSLVHVPDLGTWGGRSLKFREGALLIEHETGPEILAAIADFGNVAAPYLAVVELAALVGGVGAWLARKINKNSLEKSPDRYYHDARYLRVEVRTVGREGAVDERVITIIEVNSAVDPKTLAGVVRPALDELASNTLKRDRSR